MPTNPPFRRHKLTGDRNGQFAVNITEQSRLIFRQKENSIIIERLSEIKEIEIKEAEQKEAEQKKAEDKETVGKFVKSNGGEILNMVRYEVGEGIEKKQENFAEEVMNQIHG